MTGSPATGSSHSFSRAIGGLVFALALVSGLASWAQERMERLPPVAGEDLILWPESGGLFAPGGGMRGASIESGSPVLAHLLADSPIPEAADLRQPAAVNEPGPSPGAYEWWCWQLLPDGMIYPCYMAGVKEPRFSATWVYEKNQGWLWDVTMGARVGLLRYGTNGGHRPEGWQIDMEGAVFPRLDVASSLDLVAMDFRYGVPLSYGRGPYQTKLAFYHLSSHLGDEFMLKNPTVPRINFRRDTIVWGHSFYWTEDLRLYAEVGCALCAIGGSEPWEFQFGIDYSAGAPTGRRPVPFFAINGHLRQEVEFGGNLSVQTGWLWRGVTGHLLRMGMHYFTGKSDQYEFFNQNEDKIGLGIWYDY